MKSKSIGERMKEIRGDISQRQAAALVGIKPQNWNVYEKDQSTPGAEVVIRLCQHFGVSADWLLGLSEVRTTSKTVDEAARGVRSRLKVLDPNQALRAEIDALKRRMNALESSTTMKSCG